MAYQTGSAAHITALLEKLAIFAQDLGWEIALHTERKLYLSTPVVENLEPSRFAIEFDQRNRLYHIPCSGFNMDKPAYEQPGCPAIEGNCARQIKTQTSDLENAPFVSYDFFGTKDYLHVVVEIKPGQFRHFGIGKLQKSADFQGGEYAFGTWISAGKGKSEGVDYENRYGMSSGYYRYDREGVLRADNFGITPKSPWYLHCGNTSNTHTDATYYSADEIGKVFYALGRAIMPNSYSHIERHPERYLLDYSRSTLGDTLLPAPNSLWARAKDNTFVRMGILPDRYECNMRGISPRSILTINGERWMIIPSAGYNAYNSTRKTTNPSNTGFQGVAYRIVDDETLLRT